MRLLRRNSTQDRDLASFADGRVWRLTRGRDFDGSVLAFRRSLAQRAAAMGKVVRTVPDKLEPHRYVWVQFGEGRVSTGDPCVCGSNTIERVHRHWSRCSTCGSLLELVDGPAALEGGDNADLSAAPRTALDAYAQVALYRHRLDATAERCFGLARRVDRSEVLVAVTFPLDDGNRIPHPKVTGHWYYYLHEIPAEQLEPLLDLADIENGPAVSWKIHEDPGPRPQEELEPAPG